MNQLRWRAVWLVAWLGMIILSAAAVSQEPTLKDEEIRSSILNARVVNTSL